MKNKHLSPTIGIQIEIGNQLYTALRGDVVLPLFITCEGAKYSQLQHDLLEGDSLKVTKNTIKDIYDAFIEVKQTLKFEDDVDLYIVCDSEVNASSVSSFDEKYPHIIRLQSALVNLLSRDELKFVIGHEMGHLINSDTTIRAISKFIYTEENQDKMPEYIRLRTNIYEQLSELSADRYGYLACGNLESSVTALYKISSGLDLMKLGVKVSGLMAENEKRLKVFMEDKGEMFGDHPVLPIRVHALHVYATAKSEEELSETIFDIMELYCNNSEVEDLFTKFVAVAGLYAAQIDGTITDEEKAQIISRIGDRSLCPKEYLQDFEQVEDIKALFQETVQALKDLPDMDRRMMTYFVDVALADKEFTEEEMDAVFDFGNQLGFDKETIANYIGSVIRDTCVPKVL